MGVMTAAVLSLWVVYDHPFDMPEHVVARRHQVDANGLAVETPNMIVGDTLEDVREQLPAGLRMIPPELRDPNDDPNIVEVWL